MRTPLGYTQRTANGRFMYGRPSNYRLRSCMLSLVNYNGSLASVAPLAGADPLLTSCDIAAATPTPIVPGMQSQWPAPPEGGMSSPNTAGGIVVQGPGYARVDAAPAMNVVNNWTFGDGDPDETAGFASATPHTFVDVGSYSPDLTSTDAIGRPMEQIVGPVVVS